VRVACEVAYVDLENKNGYEVEGVCATCRRCGHETESYGTGDASVRRCLVLLREECPQGEVNYYFDADEEAPRQSPTAAAYERGYAAGYATAVRERPTNGNAELNADQLRALVSLCHPDRHPPERARLANAATAKLLELLEHRRAA